MSVFHWIKKFPIRISANCLCSKGVKTICFFVGQIPGNVLAVDRKKPYRKLQVRITLSVLNSGVKGFKHNRWGSGISRFLVNYIRRCSLKKSI
jgi:hypothetical protein